MPGHSSRSYRHIVTGLRVAALLLTAASCGKSNGDASDTSSGGGQNVCTVQVPEDSEKASEVLRGNESRFTATVQLKVDRQTLAPNSVLVDNVDVPVSRYIGPYEAPGGTGLTLQSYVDVGVLGADALLSVRAFNTKGLVLKVLTKTSDGFGGPDILLPETPAGQWATVSVKIPVTRLALATAKGKPASNPLRIVVASVDPASCKALVGIQSVSLTLAAQAPVVLVHGIDDNPEKAWPEYSEVLRQSGLVPDTAVDFSGLGDKPGTNGGQTTFNGSVQADVARIADRLSALERDYGTRDVHLVAHSKGGVDLINFLALRYPELKASRALRVLTLQTLASPHAGAVNADLAQPLRQWADAQSYTVGNALTWSVMVDDETDSSIMDSVMLAAVQAAVLSGSGPIDPGLSDMKTTSEAVRVDQSWPGDSDIAFASYAWDADFERSRWYDNHGAPTTPPEADDPGLKYSTDCRGDPMGSAQWSRYCIDEEEGESFFDGVSSCSGLSICGSPLWRLLAYAERVEVTSEKIGSSSQSIVHATPFGSGTWMGNDLAVTVASASHPKADQRLVYVGEAPRSVPGLRRFTINGKVEAFTATCKHTGSNHIAILHRAQSNMVECTGGDTIRWILDHAPLPSFN